jgi:oligopeptide transport system ATP-binding protein
MLLRVEHLFKTYPRQGKRFRALNDVSFHMEKGSFLGIVGESGSGKSTLSRILCGLETADSGSAFLGEKDLTKLSRQEWRKLYRRVQMIFQNPLASFHPRYTLLASIEEGIRNFHIPMPDDRFRRLVRECHLTPDLLEHFPHEVSGGECQRAACLRALCLEPQLLVCDEVTSALDVSLRLEIGELIRRLVRENGITCLFVTHDLLLARKLCDEILVLHDGRVVETGPVEKVFIHPEKEYTKQLLASVM